MLKGHEYHLENSKYAIYNFYNLVEQMRNKTNI
jgi:hypothetical protein